MALLLLFAYVAILLAASWEDLRTKTIPNEYTLFGTVLGLLGGVFYPAVHPHNRGFAPETLNIHQLGLDGSKGLVVAIGCLLLWFLATIHYRLRTRRGLSIALRLWFRRSKQMANRYFTWVIALGLLWLTVLFYTFGATVWDNLLFGLIGCAFGIVTSLMFRIGFGYALKVEALGYGDVLLQGCIGAWGGLQICAANWIVGTIVGLPILLSVLAHRKWRSWLKAKAENKKKKMKKAKKISTDNGEKKTPAFSETPFGPFLAAGAILLHFGWPFAEETFDGYLKTAHEIGWWISGAVVFGFFALTVLTMRIILYLRR